MDFNNFFVILVWLWICRYILGAGYGVYLLHKINSNPARWDWQDQYIAGLPFWIGYGIGRGAKWTKHILSARRS